MKNHSRLLIFLCLCLLAGPEAIPQLPSSEPGRTEKLTLDLQEVSLTMVLNMISQQYGLNLVLSGEVDGTVSVRLHDVDMRTALESILYPNGFNYYLNNDVIVVKPLSSDALGELESRVVTLDYAEAATVRNALESVKSDRGSVIVLEKAGETGQLPGAVSTYTPNRLLITDYPTVLEQMLVLVASMDKREEQLSIEVKIIETKIDSQSRLGLAWPTSIRTNLGSGVTVTDATEETATVDQNSPFAYNPNNGDWTWGKLTAEQVSLVLNVLEQDGNSKLISNPRITTLENHEARIAVQTVIPIPTVNRFTEGAAVQDILTFYDEEVGLSVVVTPRINHDGMITLEVEPQVEDIIGFTGSEDAQKPITISRSVKTRITVADGETAALGGLLKEDLISSEQRVPLLGHIPVLGRLLFTSKSEETSTTDLIILITPTILK